MPSTNPELGFLSGGGKIAELIAAFDWSTTPLGPISKWSASLRTTIGLALRSPVPIVMLWGEDGVMIYNDAYSIFAGQRHPQLLGSKVREGWPEVADFNDNVMRVGLAGGTLAYQDQELTLHRNGRPEQVWMNLDYSPIPDEHGELVGVMAIVVETTGKVSAEQWLSDERQRLQRMFSQAPSFMAMLSGPDHVFEMANASYVQLVGHRPVIGKSVGEALPEMAEQGFVDVLDRVHRTGEPFVGRAVSVAVQREPGAAPETRYLDFIYQPMRDQAGNVSGIFVEGMDITERHLAEQALRQSEAQFRQFAEAMPNHVWTAPPDGRLDWFNQRVRQYSGTTGEDLLDEGWVGMVHEDDIEEASARWAESLRSGMPYETEFRLRRADGSYRWHIARAVPITDATGAVTRWIGTNTDIEDQKQTAAELQQSEARLRLAIEAGRLAVWEIDLDTLTVASSPEMNRLYGFPEHAHPSAEDYASRYAPGERERVDAAGREAFGRGETDFETEARLLWPDGSEHWLLLRAQMLLEQRRIIGVAIDVTDLKRVEQRLVAAERRLRLSQNAAGIGSLELDIASGMVIGSERFWKIWGLPQHERVHSSVLENIVLPEDANIRSSRPTRESGTAPLNVQYRIRRPDNGEIRWLSRHIEFVTDASGAPTKMFGIIRDITEEKEAQSRQQMLTHELEHRIKNILAMVSAIASQTLRNTDLDTARVGFNERLRALANAHDTLTRRHWTMAPLREVVEGTVVPLPTEQIHISGPSVTLTPKRALSLALAINELGTNAQKYGALSVPDGRVEVEWTVAPLENGAGTLTWTWRESGGPPVVEPIRRGFGRFLIERVLATDFGGTVRIAYPADGVVCELVAPLDPIT